LVPRCLSPSPRRWLGSLHCNQLTDVLTRSRVVIDVAASSRRAKGSRNLTPLRLPSTCRINPQRISLARETVSGGGDASGMGNRPRLRRRPPDVGRLATAPSLHGHDGLDCGCTALGVMEYDVSCGACGTTSAGVLAMPTAGAVGDHREVAVSCACGGEAAGMAVITELLPLDQT
jgi:hypothetical protein